MKVKQRPEDFQVEELTDRIPSGAGPYALYRLEKSGWSTPDALAAVQRRWRIDSRRISFGGLKDRHARTVQFLTIYRGPQRNLSQQAIAVRYLGQAAEPYTSKDIRANRFRLTLRDLDAGALPSMEQAIDEVRREGVPNYFDDQRFGSVGSAANSSPGSWFLADSRRPCGWRLFLPTSTIAPLKKRKRRFWAHAGAIGPYAGRSFRPAMPATWRAIWLAIPAITAAPSLASVPNCAACTFRRTRAGSGTRCSRAGCNSIVEPEQLLKVALVLGGVPMHRQLEPAQLEDFRLSSCRCHRRGSISMPTIPGPS